MAQRLGIKSSQRLGGGASCVLNISRLGERPEIA